MFVCLFNRFQTSPAVKNRTQQTQSNVLHLPLKNNDYEKETLTLGDGHTKLSDEMSEPSHFIPYVRTNEIYYLDPDAPLSRPSTQDNQYQKSHGKLSSIKSKQTNRPSNPKFASILVYALTKS